MIYIVVAQVVLMAAQLIALLYLDKKAASDAPKGCPLRQMYPQGHPQRKRVTC